MLQANIMQHLLNIMTAMVKFQGDATSKYYAASIKYYEESLAMIKKANEKNQASEEKADVRDDLYTFTGNVKLGSYMMLLKILITLKLLRVIL